MDERTAVQLALRWGDVTLATACIEAPRRFVLGEGGDWEVPSEVLGAARFGLLRTQDGEVLLAIPPSATAHVSGGARSSFRPAPVHALPLGSRARLELGALSVEVDVALAEPPFRRRARFAAEVAVHHGLSFAFHAGILAMLALLVPSLGPDGVDAEEHADHVAFMLHALNGLALSEQGQLAVESDDDDKPRLGQGGDGRRSGGTGSRAAGEEGAPGSSVSPAHGGRVAVQGRHDEPDPHLAREAALREAMTYGLSIGMTTVPATNDPPTSPWGRVTSQGLDSDNARAPLWGKPIGDSFAAGGLALSGTGEGGGGRAMGMGLGEMGALGRGSGTGTSASLGIGDGLGGIGGSGAGSGAGMGQLGTFSQGYHRVRAPRVSGGDDGCHVNGRLPPEVIQRIVRSNFGKFRLCYEHGLDKNPALVGRVVTRFVIARDGTVAFASDGGSEMSDPAVSSCVVRTFTGLSFPEPAGGTVEVEYPIAFNPE